MCWRKSRENTVLLQNSEPSIQAGHQNDINAEKLDVGIDDREAEHIQAPNLTDFALKIRPPWSRADEANSQHKSWKLARACATRVLHAPLRSRGYDFLGELKTAPLTNYPQNGLTDFVNLLYFKLD